MDTSDLKKLPNGKGSFGECFIVDDKTLYKKFFRLENGDYPFEKDYFNNIKGIKNNSFVFPKKIYTKGEYTVGYTMDFIHAKNLSDLKLDFSITDFIYALDILKEDLKRINNQNIIINDINSSNILYDGLFHIIDTDLFVKEDNSVYIDENEMYLAEYLYQYITEENNTVYTYYDLIDKNEELYYANRIINNDCTLSNLKCLLFELKDALIKEIGCESDNFKEMYKMIKTRKK